MAAPVGNQTSSAVRTASYSARIVTRIAAKSWRWSRGQRRTISGSGYLASSLADREDAHSVVPIPGMMAVFAATRRRASCMNSASAAFAGSPRFRRLRNASLILVALLAAYALLGFFAVPWFVKSKIEHGGHGTRPPRDARQIEFNPFTLRARLSDFSVADRSPEHHCSGSTPWRSGLAASLWKWAPVFDAVRLVASELGLARSPDGTSNIQDIVERPRAPSSGPASGVFGQQHRDRGRHTRWTINNFAARSTVTNSESGSPFLSSLPHDAEITQ